MGEIERRSMTSMLVPSPAAISAACSSIDTIAPCPTTVTSVLPSAHIRMMLTDAGATRIRAQAEEFAPIATPTAGSR